MTDYSRALMNEIAVYAHRSLFWFTPYRTGNLARSIGDVGALSNGSYFMPFNANQRASYGAILNEAQTITNTLQNQQTGQTESYSYRNKHYKWLDRAAEAIAEQIPLRFPNIRRVL